MFAQPTTISTTHLPTLNDGAIESFRNQFGGVLIQPGDPSYDSARRVWNGMIDKHPALIARCHSVVDVVTAVNFARQNNVLVAVRGGGHNVAGNAACDGGLVIDLSPLRTVSVNPEARTVRVEAGATIGEVDRATQPYGLATPTGNVSETGIAGLTLSGGLSWLRRKHGMNIDSLLGAEIVTADGRVLWASASENADLFWGIRGGGGNFGIVTSFEFRLYPVGPEVSFLSILYPYTLARKVLTAWRTFTATAPDEVSSDLILWEIPDGPIFPEAIQGERIVGMGAVHVGPVEEGMRLLQPLRELGEPLVDMSGPLPYLAVQSAFDPLFPAHERRYYWKSLYLDHLDDRVFDALLRWNETRPSPRTFIPIRHLGGAISRVGEAETAVSNRQSPYLLSIDMAWDAPQEDARNIAWAQAFWREMHRFSGEGGVYLNFAGLGEEGQRMLQAAHGTNYERLVALKNKYDPINFFRLNQNIAPSVSNP